MRGGADLMTPGLAGGPPFPQGATKDSIVAVASVERPSVPMVVGVCEIDVSALEKVQGERGHAVRGVHWNGDELWAWSGGGRPGGLTPDHISGWWDDEGVYSDEKDRNFEDDEGEMGEGDERDGGVPLERHSATRHAEDDRLQFTEDVKVSGELEVEDRELSTNGRFLYHSPQALQEVSG